MDGRSLAWQAFRRHLAGNPYPGRGLVIGRRSDDDGWLLVYFLTGRSPNSLDRRLVADGDRLFTEPRTPGPVRDAALVLYDAMLAQPWVQVVGNGAQTREVHDALLRGGRADAALATWEREPDAPHHTPRITGVLDCRHDDDNVDLSILKANAADARLTDRFHYRPANPEPGLGYGLTTYAGDGDPLPSFAGEPLLLPLEGGAADVLEAYWGALAEERRIAIAVKAVGPDARLETLLVRNRDAPSGPSS